MEVLCLFLKTLPALFDGIGLLSKELLNFTNDLEGFFLEYFLVERDFIVFIKDLQPFDLLIDYFALFN